MKKYKLIKAYPNCDNLGLIVKQCSQTSGYSWQNEGPYDSRLFAVATIENNPEFWEEVKEGIGQELYVWKLYTPKEEPNYLITAFRDSLKKIYKIDSFGNFRLGDSIFSFNQMIATSDIYSCKNNIGDEFTIGDKAKFENIDRLDDITINNFFMDKGRIIVRSTKENCGVTREINRVFKAKEPLYTTTDGVDLSEGQNHNGLYLLNKDLTLPNDPSARVIYSFSLSDAEVCNRYLTFTSEENRDKYIKENQRKPIFVSADNVEFFESHLGGDYSLFSVLPKANWQENRYRLNDCIKFPKKEWLHFHTKEARQEYIDNNKPKFSLKEIESCYPAPTNSPLFTTFIANLKKLGK